MRLRERARLLALAVLPIELLFVAVGVVVVALVGFERPPTRDVHTFYSGIAEAPEDDSALRTVLEADPRIVLLEVRREAPETTALAHEGMAHYLARSRADPRTHPMSRVAVLIRFRMSDPDDFNAAAPPLDAMGPLGYRSTVWGVDRSRDGTTLQLRALPAWAQIALPLALIAAMLTLLRWRATDVRVEPPAPPARAARLALAALAAMLAASMAAFFLLPMSEDVANAYRDALAQLLFADGATPGPVSVLFIVLLMPLAEELMYRRWMLGLLDRALPSAVALAASALVFTAAHWPVTPAQWLAIGAAGLVLGWLWQRTRSVMACWGAHAANNLVAVLVWFS